MNNGLGEGSSETSTKYDVGCQCANKVLARSHKDSMLSASNVSNLESFRQLLTLQSPVRYDSED